MNLISLMLLACAPNSSCQEPVFNPAGTYKLSSDGESTYSSSYQDGSSEAGIYTDAPGSEELSPTVLATYDEASQTVTLGDVSVALVAGPVSACDTGDSGDTGLSTTTTNPFGPTGWSGSTVIASSPAGTLSSMVDLDGFDLGGNDCNLSLETSLQADYNATGSEFTHAISQTLQFDDSASCREALAKLKEQMTDSLMVPPFLFNWAYVSGIDFTRLEDLESITTSFRIEGIRIADAGEGTSGDTGATIADSGSRSRRATKSGFRSLMKSTLKQALKPIQ